MRRGAARWAGIGLFLLGMAGCAGLSPSGGDPAGPYLVSTIPSAGEFGVSPYTSVQMRFSQAMDPVTENGFEMYGRGGKVEGDLRWVDPVTLAFRPDSPLPAGVSYQCTLREGKTRDGAELVGVPYLWMFTVGE